MKNKTIYRVFIRAVSLFVLTALLSLSFSGCAEELINKVKDFLPLPTDTVNQPTDAPTSPPTALPPTEPTQPQIQYEKQTVYLCVRQVMEQWDGSGTSEQAHTYDAYGNRIRSENVTYGGWQEFTYDEWGNVLTQQSYSKDGTAGGRYEYTYNESGLMLSQKYFSANGSLFSAYEYVYDNSGRLVGETYQYADNDYLYEYVYSDDGTERRINTYNHGELTGYTLEQFDANGLVLEKNSYKADGSWGHRQTCEYDSQGRLILEWNFDSHELQPDYDVIYTYDENGLLVYKNVDYYYGYGLAYYYEAIEILVRVK